MENSLLYETLFSKVAHKKKQGNGNGGTVLARIESGGMIFLA